MAVSAPPDARARRPTVRQIPLGRLVLDYAIYPRGAIDDVNVRTLVDALEAGSILPPILADAASLRVVDGFHRVRAYARVRGPDAEVDVLLQPYANDAELFAAAVRANVVHGKRLTPYDLAVVAAKAKALGLERAEVAEMAGLTRARLEELTLKRTATNEGGRELILKRSIQHMAGGTLTAGQVEANQRLTGWSPQFHARQLIMLIENDLLGTLDEATSADLAHLARLLVEFG